VSQFMATATATATVAHSPSPLIISTATTPKPNTRTTAADSKQSNGPNNKVHVYPTAAGRTYGGGLDGNDI